MASPIPPFNSAPPAGMLIGNGKSSPADAAGNNAARSTCPPLPILSAMRDSSAYAPVAQVDSAAVVVKHPIKRAAPDVVYPRLSL